MRSSVEVLKFVGVESGHTVQMRLHDKIEPMPQNLHYAIVVAENNLAISLLGEQLVPLRDVYAEEYSHRVVRRLNK
jgi:hypothetical protein